MSEQSAVRPEMVRELVRITTEIKAMDAEAGVDGERGISDMSDAEFEEWMPEYTALREALDALNDEATDEEWCEASAVLNGQVSA